MTGSESPDRLEMRQISKSFGGVHALRDVTFKARAGAVHALCGENGAGKSTLMKILAGAITDFEGQIVIEGRPLSFSGPRDAEDAGVRIIYQELNLVPEMTVAANIFLGRELRHGFGWLDNRAMEAEARRLFDRLGTPISPRSRVGDLRIGDQQMVEIAKALAFEAAILIMDEPTSALSDAEVTRLYRVINDLRDKQHTVIYISHKMNEVFTLADHVTVLRDGQFVASAPSRETQPAQVVRWMVGREIAAMHYEPHPISERAVVEVQGLSLASPPLSGRPALRDLSFQVRAGEVLGVAGLLGAGRTELLEALFGASPEKPAGSIILNGQPVRFRHPSDAIAAGVALVTEDRKNLGLFNQMTVGENITIGHIDALSKAGVIDRGTPERGRCGTQSSGSRSRRPARRRLVTSLSGGNQQKCILARWLMIEPKVLLLDEPTRGIDVGAKAEIYTLIRELVRHGMAIIMTSSELPELLTVSDRIMVLCEGRKTAELTRAEANEERIMHAATQFLGPGRRASAS